MANLRTSYEKEDLIKKETLGKIILNAYTDCPLLSMMGIPYFEDNLIKYPRGNPVVGFSPDQIKRMAMYNPSQYATTARRFALDNFYGPTKPGKYNAEGTGITPGDLMQDMQLNMEVMGNALKLPHAFNMLVDPANYTDYINQVQAYISQVMNKMMLEAIYYGASSNLTASTTVGDRGEAGLGRPKILPRAFYYRNGASPAQITQSYVYNTYRDNIITALQTCDNSAFNVLDYPTLLLIEKLAEQERIEMITFADGTKGWLLGITTGQAFSLLTDMKSSAVSSLTSYSYDITKAGWGAMGGIAESYRIGRLLLVVSDKFARLPYYASGTLDFLNYSSGVYSDPSTSQDPAFSLAQRPVDTTQRCAVAVLLGKEALNYGSVVINHTDTQMRAYNIVQSLAGSWEMSSKASTQGNDEEVYMQVVHGAITNDFFDKTISEIAAGTVPTRALPPRILCFATYVAF